MFRLSTLLCMVSTVVGIIVRDPLPTPRDYKYSYNIEDASTGDRKSQHEVRLGDVVSGAYTVLGPDGTKRTVEYTADAHHGFQAVVSEEPATPQVTYQRAQKPVNIPVRPLPYFPKDSYPSERVKSIVYFTPVNEIKSNSVSFNQGEYFIPAK